LLVVFEHSPGFANFPHWPLTAFILPIPSRQKRNDMGKILATVCLAWVTTLTQASVIADWTFETGAITSGFGINTDYGHADVADAGISTAATDASGHHANTSTGWSLAAGNGSEYGLDADHWGLNDYFQFSASTAGFSQITISYDQISSSTGPGKFLFEYSTDGTTFNPVGGDYTITRSSWNASSHTGLSTFTEKVASISGLNNDATAVFRLVDDSTTSEGNGIVATGGASHVDNFIINGIPTAVPEPSEFSLVFSVGLVGICVWRRQHATGRKTKTSKAKS
jgi:hypothetical protein